MTPVQRAAHLALKLGITSPDVLAREAQVKIADAVAALNAVKASRAPLVAPERRPQ